MDSIKGDGPYTHGNSFANGKPLPGWVSWELREVLEARNGIWAFLP